METENGYAEERQADGHDGEIRWWLRSRRRRRESSGEGGVVGRRSRERPNSARAKRARLSLQGQRRHRPTATLPPSDDTLHKKQYRKRVEEYMSTHL